MLRPAARTLRRLISRIVPQSTTRLSLDPTAWHAYSLEWLPGLVRFRVDGDLISSAPASPRGPLGLVLWIDNQYAAFTPEGRVRFGSLACEREAWIELKDIQAAGGG